MVITSWNQRQGQLIRFDAADKDVWTKRLDAIWAGLDFGNELFVLTRAEPRIVWFSLDGAELRSMDLPAMYRKVQLLPDGGLVAASKEEKGIGKTSCGSDRPNPTTRLSHTFSTVDALSPDFCQVRAAAGA